MKKIGFILGTRPEVIKLAPLIKMVDATDGLESFVCVTAQHREMMDQMLSLFDIQPDCDLDLMRANQNLATLSSAALSALDSVLSDAKPDWVVVQGDTTSTFIGALASFYRHIPVAHIEAGLRSGNKATPWPEEANRCLTTQLATYHFAPTEMNRQHLLRENVADDVVHVVGNTVVDALAYVSRLLEESDQHQDLVEKYSDIDFSKKVILVTGHRRESFGEGFQQICSALQRLATFDDVQLVYPVHLNPNVKDIVTQMLGRYDNVHLLPPQDYLSFIYLMKQTTLILTDSGGIQEEAPAFGIPVCVMRDVTERQEAIDAGTAKLVGTNADEIVKTVQEVLTDSSVYEKMARAHNPFGDGHASKKIVKILQEFGN